MNKNTFLALAAAAMTAGSDPNLFCTERRSHTDEDNKPDYQAPIHVTDNRQLREFSVQGHKIMAYSRKDAITWLKHQKLI